ncbi:quinone-dependent dihydroorotate dehydrogenase [Chachezhania sediminis]|uniref:quinone-dependent dihydroorotate dehydrogenase n=1 Tax=Chachezhania sediminis TaxID=2599291 RepID=UPI00131A68BD|nr:quinone-dependent dihydroorotate dehydrogenase [Chachezhania sediminis]
MSTGVERFGLKTLHKLDPETAHGLALKALRLRLVRLPGKLTTPRLQVKLAGLDLPNPVGLAAGFDKNAVALAPLGQAGFGFVEVGAVTPRPQPGNPKPRLFRLTEDQAAINRFGFNNDGMAIVAARLARRRKHWGIVGLNLGANKDSEDRAGDFARVLATCGRHVDFATVNVSSPNTERLRDLQGKAALSALLTRVMDARAALPVHIPVFLKISPDLTLDEIGDIADVALEQKLDGIIATNTTLSREGLKSPQAAEAGGISGAPLFDKSTRVLAMLHAETGGRIPLIGVGGVRSAEDAYAKIRAGATAVQVYTAMVFEGMSLIPRIVEGLDKLLERDGFSSLTQARGVDRNLWL